MPRGQKTCPNCQQTTGPRTQVCPGCGYDFSLRSTPKPTTQQPRQEGVRPRQVISQYGVRNVSIPGQSPGDKKPFCPAKPKGNSEEEVKQWIEDVLAGGIEKNQNYLRSAVKYFAREFWPILGDDYYRVCEIIDNFMENREKPVDNYDEEE